MRHQYMTDVFWKILLQQWTDFFVDRYSKYFGKNVETVHATSHHIEPEQILVITLGHLGDALIASYIFPVIRRRYPDTAIDVLAGEWCTPVLEHNPYIRDLIFFDHFRVNRLAVSVVEKIRRHMTTARSARKEIQLKHYDISLEGRVHYPNGNLLSYRGGITRRIGFGSGGYGSLLTDEILFPSQPNFHLIDALVEELRRIGIDVRGEHIQPYFTPAVEAVHTSHPFASYFHLPFIILHPESGNIKRRLGREFWLRIVQNILRTTDHMVMVCGIARSSSDLSRYLSVSLSNGKDRIIDTVGKLSLDEFFVLSRYARSAFTLESLAAHLCSINCETISFFNNGSGALFFPLPNKKTTVIHNHLPSKDAYVHPKIVNHYVNEIESEETFALLKEIIHSIALPFTAS